MLPKFPEFKRLELSDRQDIVSISSRYEPYSDFDFPCMWSWNVGDNVMVSELNGNFVAILADHFTNTPFYTFLGNNDINKTLKQLFAFSGHTKNSQPTLRLVPEVSLAKIDFKKYLIEIDLNNYDYIYDLKLLSEYPGNKFSDKRRKINHFLRNNPEPIIEILDLNDPLNKEKIIALNKFWLETKIIRDPGLDSQKEFKAIERFLNANFADIVCVSVVIEQSLAAYAMFTPSSSKYAIAHFAKADLSNYGIYEYLINQSAIILLQKGYSLLNYQEDLGLSGLRFFKNSFNPTGFLRKYSVREL